MDICAARTAHIAAPPLWRPASAAPEALLGFASGVEAAGCSYGGLSISQFTDGELLRHRGRSAGSRSRGFRNFVSSNSQSGSNNLGLWSCGGDSLGLITCEVKEEGNAAEELPGPSSDNGAASFLTTSPLKVKGAKVASSTEAADGGPGSPSGASPNRAGLRRTPITGSVQSATSSHDLPHPSVAVRNLIQQARYAHLCTIMSRMHHRRRGYPFGSIVDFATDPTGHPIFHFSPLAIHTRNLLADPRCTLVVQMPGWSGLANARVTLFGDVYPLPAEEQEMAHKYYTAKHQHGACQRWGNFYYYRMEAISDIYFVGGFGTVAWVDVKEYQNAAPDNIATADGEGTLQELNTRFSKPLRELLSAESEIDDAALISIDSKGIDIRVRQGAQFNVQRLSFDERNAVETLEQAEKALQKVLEKSSRRHS